ncbi:MULTISPECIES: hypothetical protein [Rhizobium]|uniref:Uncharacterized protein n=2 Tax=Rhizobium TaxID=379 RepID=A0A179C149_RHILE|nr:hypothetical protein [Rhizobium leguminosarum]ANP90784.1 hypothetical protein BA011_31810 [Rhizobium leguminosarum]API56857.1 hypothetical protein BMW22_35365 [Rhizobium leguminosarum]OAP97103.1 hypothetical protein A4U53_36950 [Rhizobium leguminosarum]
MRTVPSPSSVTSRQTTGGNNPPTLRIARAGRASVHNLGPGTYTVGGGPTCDFVILGCDPEPALRLHVSDEAKRMAATIEALRDGVAIGDSILHRGERVSIGSSETIHFADVECHIENLSAYPPVRQPLTFRRMAAACLLILAAPLLYIGFGPDREPARDIQTAQIKTVAPQPTASSITEELGEAMRLAGLKLGAKLANNGNEIRIGEGSKPLDIASKTQLDGILAAISRRSPVPVVDMTTLSSGLAGFVAAAGYAPVKFVVGNDGRRYREGETVSGDWRIKEIRPGEMVVARGKETDTISFDPAPDKKLRLARTAGDGGA